MGAVDLAVDVPGVDEENLLLSVGVGGLLAPVEEPEGARKGHGVEEVLSNGDHDVDGPFPNHLLSDLKL